MNHWRASMKILLITIVFIMLWKIGVKIFGARKEALTLQDVWEVFALQNPRLLHRDETGRYHIGKEHCLFHCIVEQNGATTINAHLDDREGTLIWVFEGDTLVKYGMDDTQYNIESLTEHSKMRLRIIFSHIQQLIL